MSAREDILQKVRTAIQDVTEENPTLDVPLSRSCGQPLATADVLADFVEKVRDYRATVVRVPAPQLPQAIAEALAACGAASVVLPTGVPAAWAATVAAAAPAWAARASPAQQRRRPAPQPSPAHGLCSRMRMDPTTRASIE